MRRPILQTVEVNFPDFVELDAHEVLMIVASSLYEKGRISLGDAAELAGYSKRTFMELLGKYDVSVFNYDHNEIAADLENA